MQIVSLMPAFGGVGVVARGLGLTMGASWGWGGGVARCRLSWRMYVPGASCKRRYWGQGEEDRIDSDLLRLTVDTRDR